MDTIKQINNHRSIRRFQDRAIEPALLDEILACGLRASNTGNMQIYSIIVTQEPELRKKLSDLHYGQGASAPTHLTICVDINRYHHWCRLRGCDEPYDNLLWLLSGAVDASLCAQNICIAAESKGLGICYLGTVLYNTEAIAKLLNTPQGVVPVISIAMGYPDEQPALSERLELEGIVHNETYHDYSDDDIDRIHRVREEFPFNQEMVRQNGTRNLAEIFTKIRYPKKDNIAISKSLYDFIQNNFCKINPNH
ncbi:MAG: nitroreductase family protein [Bacteroidales bacterium]|nr:nitroreductase family protein [Bacteroidales bacterium]